MIDKTEIDTFISQNTQQKKVNIFAPYTKDILYMREKNVALKVILKFLITKDSEIKNRYNNDKKFQTGVAFLSASIKRFQKNKTTEFVENSDNKTTQKEVEKTTPQVAPEEPKKDTKSKIDRYLQLGKTMTEFQKKD